MNSQLAGKMKSHAELLTSFMSAHFSPPAKSLPPGHALLLESARYSLLQEGGKRFRPVLAMLTSEALGSPAARVLAFAAAVECVHTYSLIHDDLPAMDNDDFRRGQPTNHRKFNEATAILAGDSLLTEAFQILGDHYVAEPDLAVAVIRELSRAAGLYGMVGGQAIDMGAKKDTISLTDLRLMHELKTGALIRVSAVGAAILCRAGAEKLRNVTLYAENLGLAFQVADDILDYDEKKIEPGSYPAVLGLDKTRAFLQELTDKALGAIAQWPVSAELLREIARYNGARSF